MPAVVNEVKGKEGHAVVAESLLQLEKGARIMFRDADMDEAGHQRT